MAEEHKLILSVDSRQVKTAEKDLDGLSKSAGNTEKQANKTASALTSLNGVLKTLAVGALIKQTIDIADEYNNLQGRLKLVTTSAENLALVQDKLFKISQSSRTDLATTTDLYFRLAKSTESLGIGQERLLKVTESISKTLAISGSSAEAANAALMQLGQGFASGTLRGEELNSVLEQAPALAEAIAKGMGTTVGKLKALAAEGKLTSEEVFKAIEKQGKAIEDQFKKMPQTVGQSMTMIGNSLLAFIGQADDATEASTGLAGAIGDFAKALDDNREDIVLFGLFTYEALVRAKNGFVLLYETAELGIEGIGALPSIMAGKFTSTVKEQIADLMITANSAAKALGMDKFFSAKQIQSALLEANRGLEKASASQRELSKNAKDWREAYNKFAPSVEDNVLKKLEQINKAQGKLIKDGPSKAGAKPESAEDKKAREKAQKEAERLAKDIEKARLDAIQDSADREAQMYIGIHQAKLDAEQDNIDRMTQMAIDQYKAQEDAQSDSYERQAQAALAFYEMTLSEKDKINADMLAMWEANQGLFNTEQMQTFFTQWQESIEGIKGGYKEIQGVVSSFVEESLNSKDWTTGLKGNAKAVANLGNAFKDLDKQNKKYETARKKIAESKLTDEEKSIANKDIEEAQYYAQIDAYGALAGAAAGFFEEGSSMAKAMAVVQGALAVVSAGAGGDPYTVIPRMIAAAAMVAQTLSSSGISGGPSASAQAPVDTAKYASDQADFIVDRLDRQIELLESIDQGGTAAKTKVALAGSTFEADIAKMWADMIGTGQRVKTFITDKHINVTGNKLTDVQSVINTLESWGAGLRQKDWDWLDMDQGTFLEYRSQLEDAVSSFAMSLGDVRSTVSDSSEGFKEIYDSLSGTDFYKMRDLQAAYVELGNSIVGNTKDSMLSYISDAVSKMEDLGEGYLETTKSILSDGTVDEQVTALKGLSSAFGKTFNDSTEEALNFLDSIELVAENMARISDERAELQQTMDLLTGVTTERQLELLALDESNRALQEAIWAEEARQEALDISTNNIKSFTDSLLTAEQRLNNLASSMDMQVAQTSAELNDMFKTLSGGVGGLTNEEMELLTANKSEVDKLNAEREKLAEEQAKEAQRLAEEQAKEAQRWAEEQARAAEQAAEDARRFAEEQQRMMEDVFSTITDFVNELRGVTDNMTLTDSFSGFISAFDSMASAVATKAENVADLTSVAIESARLYLGGVETSASAQRDIEFAKAMVASKFESVAGFSSGGYTGDGAVNAVAGLVHKGEYVVNAQTTRDLGLNNSNGVFNELLKEIRDLKNLNIQIATSSINQLHTQRAILSETIA